MRAKEYGDWWLTTVKGNIADSTYQEYEGYPVLGDKLFAKVTRPMIRDLMAEKRKKYEPATVRNMLAPVRAMYNQAIEDGEPIPMNPAARFGKKNKGKQKTIINPYSKEETSKFLREALSKVVKDYPLYLCADSFRNAPGRIDSVKGLGRRLRRSANSCPTDAFTRHIKTSEEWA